ncbi:hypothetical protein B0H13DRAFT_2340286 [Mycena leptocephala]|nr:hypothetical protein B0H13DRAFT_2340286 [Mycena leptocephala]
MTITLTDSHLRSFLDAASREGNWLPFINAIDPDVRWVIGSEKKDAIRKTGVYNLASWIEEVNTPLRARLQGNSLKMHYSSLNIFGNTAIVEATSEATQMNGNPYKNRYCWFFRFSEETGKIVEITLYLDTALVKDVFESNNA